MAASLGSIGSGSHGPLKNWVSIIYQSNQSFNSHSPPPGATPGHLNFFKICVKFAPSRAEKMDLQMPPPLGKIMWWVLTFQWLLLCLWSCICKHGLLDNTLICHKILGILDTSTSSQTLLTHYQFTSSGQNKLNIHWRFYIVPCNNTYILHTYTCIIAKCFKIFIDTPGQSKQLTSINQTYHAPSGWYMYI